MLTGYNTDITHKGTIYHVQTEDGGENNPVIVSLVYQGGRILASKKTSYAQIVGTEGFMSQLRQMLEDQHRDMIKAVKTGTLAAEASSPPATAAPKAGTDTPAPPTDHSSQIPPIEPRQSFKEKNLDQVILEYLASEMEEE
jgi:hypothetical protein